MKLHSNNYKTNITTNGRELDSIITYELNSETIELGAEELNSISPHYKADIFKSVMKQLDIDSNVDIPTGTEINYQFGVKVNDSYEYLNFGNYIVYSSEKQEDLKSYKIIAYDKMLNSMKDYENLDITYPISIRDYINAICTHLGLTFANVNDTFPNYNRMIQNELYLTTNGETMGYKFRDVLDELAQVTGSIICINNDDELEIRYITETNDTINENFFKDINVNFGEKYGPVNSIVLSRSGGADNVYLRDDQSIAQNGLCEIKISDNQIMNWNDRADYLPDLLSKLDGLEYYINDFSSYGITYYDLCDRYTVLIDNNYYSCVMLNDEINVTQGLEENVYTEKPIPSETDYSKADKTDRKINQTYLIVDKQNQTIQSVITETTDTSNPDSIASKQSVLTQRVDNLESAISDIADITITGESTQATVDLDNINQSEPIVINVKPISQNVSYLYPRDNLYPSDTLYMTDRKVRLHNNTTNEDIDYVLPDDLLYYDSENYDEFMLDYNSQTCKVIKKCKYNADGTVGLLSSPIINTYTYPTIDLTDGDYTVSLLGYNTGYLFVRLMSKNIYTEQFYTKSETNSLINQTAGSINLSVDQKLSNYSTTTEMNSAITLKANEINSVVATKVGNDEVISKINQSSEQVQINANKISLAGKQINLSSDNISIDSGNFSVDSGGNVEMNGARIDDGDIIITEGTIQVDSDDFDSRTKMGSNTLGFEVSHLRLPPIVKISYGGVSVDEDRNSLNHKQYGFLGPNRLILGYRNVVDNIYLDGTTGEVKCIYVTQTSKEENKKDFEKLENALEIIKNTDIYKYHFKEQKDKDKKHIGFVIGDKYKYSKEITSQDNDGVDLYSMIGVCFKAIQELQEEIEELKKGK